MKNKSSGHPPSSQALRVYAEMLVSIDMGTGPQTLTLVCFQGVKLSTSSRSEWQELWDDGFSITVYHTLHSSLMQSNSH